MNSYKPIVLSWHSVEADSVKIKHTSYENPTLPLFREQIKFILSNYTAVPINEFLELSEGHRLPGKYSKPPILLTFDDGFQNTFTLALSVLQEFKVPALVFVIAGVLIEPDFVPWFLEPIQMLRKTCRQTVHFKARQFNLSADNDRKALQSTFGSSFRACRSDSEHRDLLAYFAESLGVDRPTGRGLDEDLRLVTKEDLNNLTSPLLTVGSHGMTHRNLTGLTRHDVVYELEQSHRLLRQHCRSYYPAFAYPGGSFSTQSISIAKNTYRMGFALLHGSSYNDPYAYPRIGIGNDTIRELSRALSTVRLKYVRPIKRLLRGFIEKAK